MGLFDDDEKKTDKKEKKEDKRYTLKELKQLASVLKDLVKK